jgi:Right handed beta helix region/PKD-like domain
VDPCLPGTGTLRVSDYAGNTCDTPISLAGNAPSAAITAPGSVQALSTGNSASVPDAGPGSSYSWGITNGTITGGVGTRSVTFTAGASGSVGLNVTVQNAGGCSSGNSTGVSITPVARSFVSAKKGNDANNCAPSTPCRTFTRALSPVQPGGEVVVLDSGGYGPFTITQAVAVVVPQGVYAGITASSGDAITVSAGVSDAVTLKGLTINSLGGVNGIRFSTGGALVVESCTISGFSDGIRAEGPGDLAVRDTRLRNATSAAVHLLPSSPSHAALFRCRLEDNAEGLSVTATASAWIEESVSSGNSGASVSCAAGDVTVDDCLLAGNGTGASASGTGTLRISNSCVTDNATGLAQSGGGALLSRADNTVEGNVTSTSGSIGAYSPK